MDEGWIKLYRVIKKHWIWEDPQKLKWWLDILLSANHQDKKILLGNDLVLIKRGSFHTSELKLSERWGVSKTTVRKFLDLLKNDCMIETEKSKKGTTIKVSNYADYQAISEDEKTIKKPQKNHNVYHKETIKEPYAIPQKNHKVYTNKNEKNDKELKNEKNDKEREEITPTTPHLSFGLDLDELDEAHKLIAENVTETSYLTFFKPCDIECEGNKIIITAPNKFTADCIKEKYVRQVSLLTGREIVVKEV